MMSFAKNFHPVGNVPRILLVKCVLWLVRATSTPDVAHDRRMRRGTEVAQQTDVKVNPGGVMTPKAPSVLCPIDFSEFARVSLVPAVVIAGHFGARFIVLSAMNQRNCAEITTSHSCNALLQRSRS
jgi:hypothetical protein